MSVSTIPPLIFCNTFSSPKPQLPCRPALQVRNSIYKPKDSFFYQQQLHPQCHPIHHKGLRQICWNALKEGQSENPVSISGVSGGNGDGRDWSTSLLLLALWGGLIYYVFNLAPNQAPLTDMYLLKKLLNLKGDVGYPLNEVLVAQWYIMGLWPLLYTMLLLPTGRSSKAKVPVWPFLVLSCFGEAYVLLPYFVLWSPPPPPVDEDEIRKRPLNIPESNSLPGRIGSLYICRLSWCRFMEGIFPIHVTALDFTLLSTFAPFWVYNDMTTPKWYDKGSWLPPLSLILFLGPALYVFLGPSMPVSHSPTTQVGE